MYRDWIKLHNRKQRNAVSNAKNAARYYKLSSNQLIKTLMARGNG
jgi:prolyl-tRNA editing enzyme YbaK/EbsC (Cys-tRNA(Pro) deacylase)